MTTLQEFRDQNQLAKTNAVIYFDAIAELANDMPDDCPAPSAIIVHPTSPVEKATVKFENQGVLKLLNLFPPEPLTFVQSTVVKPSATVTKDEREQQSLVDIYPVISQLKEGPKPVKGLYHEVSWWGHLAGQLVLFEAQATTFDKEFLPGFEKYEAFPVPRREQSITTVYRKKLAQLPPPKNSPVSQSREMREDFVKSNGLRSNQVRMLNSICAFPFLKGNQPNQQGRSLTFDDLPPRQRAERGLHVLEQIGNFWDLFEESKAQAVVDFVNTYHDANVKYTADYLQELEKVQPFLENLLSGVGRLTHCSAVYRNMAYALEKETGLQCTLVFDGSDIHVYPFGVEPRRIVIPMNLTPGGKPLLAQDIPVDYA
ncbi:hypothetical protein LC612_37015 [Nostoc sp. CHAB 5834]|nr:hypothetical protein [Nostoc sp. CHAB 5834]